MSTLIFCDIETTGFHRLTQEIVPQRRKADSLSAYRSRLSAKPNKLNKPKEINELKIYSYVEHAVLLFFSRTLESSNPKASENKPAQNWSKVLSRFFGSFLFFYALTHLRTNALTFFILAIPSYGDPQNHPP